jgi:PTH1 family peptidyl-tRNA hydrolase
MIAGLGNPGRRYEGTRHNVGFDVVAKLLETVPKSEVEERGGGSEVAWVRVRLPLRKPTPLPERPGPERTEEELEAWREAKRAARDATELGPVVLATPLAFMNRSGPPLRRVLEESFAAPADLLVVVDDVDLEAGVLRLRRAGSSGGHRGLESIEDALGTQEFARLRLGVGRNPPGVPSEEWVLERPSGGDAEAIARGVERAVLAVRAWLAKGPERAMDEFNKRASE